MTNFIDITPTWGEIGRLYNTLNTGGESQAAKHMWPEIARA